MLGSSTGTTLEGGLGGFCQPAFGQGALPRWQCWPAPGWGSAPGAKWVRGCPQRGASPGVFYRSRLMLALDLPVKGSHLLVMLHNFSCLRNLDVHPSVSKGKVRLARPWHYPDL